MLLWAFLFLCLCHDCVIIKIAQLYFASSSIQYTWVIIIKLACTGWLDVVQACGYIACIMEYAAHAVECYINVQYVPSLLKDHSMVWVFLRKHHSHTVLLVFHFHCVFVPFRFVYISFPFYFVSISCVRLDIISHMYMYM